jgi:hypothetical protein
MNCEVSFFRLQNISFVPPRLKNELDFRKPPAQFVRSFGESTMIFSATCPKCGTKKEYLAEEAGLPGHCLGCGTTFELRKQNLKVFKHVAVATLAVGLGVSTMIGRQMWKAQARSQRWEAAREQREAERERRIAADILGIEIDDDKDDP